MKAEDITKLVNDVTCDGVDTFYCKANHGHLTGEEAAECNLHTFLAAQAETIERLEKREADLTAGGMALVKSVARLQELENRQSDELKRLEARVKAVEERRDANGN